MGLVSASYSAFLRHVIAVVKFPSIRDKRLHGTEHRQNTMNQGFFLGNKIKKVVSIFKKEVKKVQRVRSLNDIALQLASSLCARKGIVLDEKGKIFMKKGEAEKPFPHYLFK